MGALNEILIEVTNRCSLKCLHCSSDAGFPYQNELSLDEIVDVLSQAKGLGADTFTISGGEPMLRDDIKEIITLAMKKGFKIRLHTTGAYGPDSSPAPIDNDFLDFFSANSGEGDRIVYSLYGASSLTHENITSMRGSFNPVLRSIKETVRRKIPVDVHTVPNAMNYKEMGDLVLMLSKEKVLGWHPLRLVGQGRCTKNQELLMNSSQFEELQENLIKLSNMGLDINLKLYHHIDKRYWSDGSYPIGHCTIGRNKMIVRANGDVTYCTSLKYMGFGDIREHSLRYFWEEHPSIISFKEFIEQGYKKMEGKCSLCDILDSCRGGCTAQRLHSYNDLFRGPDPLCYREPKKQ